MWCWTPILKFCGPASMAPYWGDPQNTSAVRTGDRLLLWGQRRPDGASTQPLLSNSPAIGLSYGG
jgi:hypothetical protein